METLTLNIKGMTCGGCVKSVTSVLQKISGVSKVEVSLEQNQANITYDPAQAKLAQFTAAIEDAGFDVI
ncbi:MAG TPA: cation transporter [Gallionellaceae bacterium]|jgi:copper chaperone|nr:cation transporter [Gallionellaceae bacterium]